MKTRFPIYVRLLIILLLSLGITTAQDSKLTLTYTADGGGWTNVANLIDGNVTTKATSNAHPNWVEFSLGSYKTITRARLNEDNEGTQKISNWKAQYLNGSVWTDAFAYTDTPNSNGDRWNSVDFPDVITNKIRVYMDNTSTLEVFELELYGSSTLLFYKFHSTIIPANAGTSINDDFIIPESQVNIIATPNQGYIFDHWSGDISGTNNPYSITANRDLNITANFIALPSGTVEMEITSLPFLINRPGNYYLTKSLTTTTSGIKIFSPDVNIDMRGYSIVGSGKTVSQYIGIENDRFNNISIKNGTISGFLLGGVFSGALNLFDNMIVTDNLQYGLLIEGGGTTIIKNSTALRNGIGFWVTNGFIINSVANQNTVGIDAKESSVSNCIANNNTNSGIDGYESNLKGNTTINNGAYGILATNSLISQNVCIRNIIGNASIDASSTNLGDNHGF